jgi:hypothetical protein
LLVLPLAAGCPTVDLGDAPVAPGSCRPDPGYFRDVIWPEMLAPADQERSCVAEPGCHRQEDGRSALRLIAEPMTPADHDDNYDVVTAFLNCGSPGASALLTKPESGTDSHGGGDLFDPGSEPSTAFLGWFDQ